MSLYFCIFSIFAGAKEVFHINLKLHECKYMYYIVLKKQFHSNARLDTLCRHAYIHVYVCTRQVVMFLRIVGQRSLSAGRTEFERRSRQSAGHVGRREARSHDAHRPQGGSTRRCAARRVAHVASVARLQRQLHSQATSPVINVHCIR